MKNPDRLVRRVLSIDGAGIYGLSAALWLERMCAADPTFLGPDSIDLFAGTSSGAVNALLLARRENPRDACKDLVSFWKAAEPWSLGKDPLRLATTLLGFTAWYDTGAFLGFLREQFGDTRLRDLPNRVLVTGYDFGGKVAAAEAAADPDRRASSWRDHVLAPWARAENGALGPHAQPVAMTNFAGSPEADRRVVDVAYAATAMPSLRAIRGGMADGGLFNANPSTLAIAAALEHAIAAAGDAGAFTARMEVLAGLAMLSIGDGTKQPSYLRREFDYGPLAWSFLPVNPPDAPWPPGAYCLQAPAQMSDRVAAALIGRHKYFRLNPGVIDLPTAATVTTARNPFFREWIVRHVEAAIARSESTAAVDAALRFIASDPWQNGPEVTRA